MRILVTGASGFVGSCLVPTLLAQGHEVVALGGPNWRPTISHANLTARPVDLTSNSICLADIQRLDSVIWLAQGNGYKDFPDQAVPLVAVNLLGLTRVLDLARRAGAMSFVYASTGNVYAPSLEPMAEDAPLLPDDLYSCTKHAGEELVKLYQPWMTGLCVRIFGVYGPGQQNRLLPNLLSRIVNGQLISLESIDPAHPDEGLQWTPCHVRDVAVLLARLAHPLTDSATLNLAGPEKVSIAQVANIAGESLGRPVHFEHLPQARQRNFIADTRLLQSRFPDHTFIPFSAGLSETISPFLRQVPGSAVA
jgi:nucleoside-diphosphate-sugar epimerase